MRVSITALKHFLHSAEAGADTEYNFYESEEEEDEEAAARKRRSKSSLRCV